MAHSRQPLKNTSSQPIIKQHLLAGVFTANLEFLSKFLGHQGASAKFLCMLCLATKARLKLVFDNAGERTPFEKRTSETMIADGKVYDEMMNGLSISQRKKKRPGVIPDLSFSWE